VTVTRALVTVGIALLAVAPVLAVALATSRTRDRWLLPVVAGVLALDMVLAMAPAVGPFRGLAWNWQGKILETLVTIVAASLLSRIPLRELGVGFRLEPGSAGPVWLAALLCVAGAAIPVALGMGLRFSLETLLFQATMPGLSEEFMRCGAAQSLLDRVFVRPWTVIGARLGWGGLLPALYFMALHVLAVSPRGSLVVSLGGLPSAAILGLMLAWMRGRSGSVWPGIVAHNGFNTLQVVGPVLLAWMRHLVV